VEERALTRRNALGPGSVVGDRGQQTQRRLMDAAVRVFARRGLHAARIEEITAGAGVSRAAFYQYFDGKDALFAELLREVEHDVVEAASSFREASPDRDGYVALREWIETYLAVANQWNPMLKAFIESESLEGRHRGFRERLVGDAGRLIGRRLRGGLPAAANADITAVALLAMLDRFSYASFTYELHVDHATVVETLAFVSFRMLYPGVDPDDRGTTGRRDRIRDRS